MNIKRVVVGNLQANCYILSIDENALIVDPGDEYEKIKKNLGNLNIKGILITHRHFDHIGALNYFKDIPIYEYSNLEEKTYEIDKFKFDVIYTKGHTSDSITFYFKDYNVMFTGDFLFQGTIGRTDLETGSIDEMKCSLDKIKKYSNVMIYPGHGNSTELEIELMNNPYLRSGLI